MRAVVCLLLVIAGCGKVVGNVPGGTCTTAAECTDPTAPFCVGGACQATCDTAADCTDPATPLCAADGACVGCETNDQCDAAAPICDATARACRGCTEDSECAGGVCIEADGTCVADADVSFVTMDGDDLAACTRSAPCETLKRGIDNRGARTVIHILGGTLSQQATVALTGTLAIDGEDTTLTAGNQQTFAITSPADIIIENVRMTSPAAAAAALPAVSITGAQSKVVFESVDINGNNSIALRANTASVTLRRSHIGTLGATDVNTVVCEDAKLTIDQSVFETSLITDDNLRCTATIRRSRFETNRDGSVQFSAGQLVMENNLIIHRAGLNDSLFARGLNAGSVIRFNTFINTTALPSDGLALSCDASVTVTSNVFAYNSGHPIGGTGCAPKFSVFDDVSLTSAGAGNQVTGIETIFVNRAAGDFHLAEGSKARGAAEPGLETMVTSDFEGNPRPSPAGSASDSGAFEAP